MEPIHRLDTALEGRYRIDRELGEGGMATVYLAQDLRHDRRVAIKVLRPELAAVVGAERFLSEIKTTANLHHPHILPLFDSGEAGDFLFYVMPYVEGESLRERLDRERQLPVDEAMALARKVADALDYAHERGVVHRDVKPGNVLLSERGEPLVADFGIALAVSQAGAGRITETGLSLGTPHYMSPEQAAGERTVDARSDVYSLGCVLYEMLTGEPPHGGPTSQAVLARILTGEPQRVSALRRTVPPHVDAAVAKALEKLPADRFPSTEAFTRALSDHSFRWEARTRAGKSTPGSAAGDAAGRTWLADNRSRMAIAGTVLLTLGAFALGRAWSRVDGGSAIGRANAPPSHQYLVDDTLRDDPVIAISSRGDVAYRATSGGRRHLRIRRAADTGSIEVPGTEGATDPVFSPDGEWLAFESDGEGELRKVQIGTGTAVTLVPSGEFDEVVPSQWTAAGTILFRTSNGGIYRIPEVGGRPELIHDAEAFAVFPRILPGGRILLYTVVPGRDPNGARLKTFDLETGDTATLVEGGGNGRWSETGHILHGHASGTLFALPFDLEDGEVTGPAVPVRESVFTFGNISFFDVSPTGSLAHVTGGTVRTNEDVELGWVDMTGVFTSLRIEPIDHPDVRLSPDGEVVAYRREGDIYLYDLSLGTNQRFTFEGIDHHDPVWSPGGSRLAFSSNREGGEGGEGLDLWVKDVDGGSPAEWLAGSPDALLYPHEWLEDRTIVLTRGVDEDSDILMVPADEPGAEPTPLLRADWEESGPRVSPDGSLMAYISDETGRAELFVRAFPSMTGRQQVSESGIAGQFPAPVWSNDGTALYYLSGEGNQVIRTDLERDTIVQIADHTVLFELPGTPEDLGTNGRRLLVSRVARAGEDEPPQPGIMVVANWFTELRGRLGDAP